MKIVTLKVFSYCEDFTEEEQKLLEDYPCDVFVAKNANSKEFLENHGYSNDTISNKLIKLGCNENEEVFIHIDY